MINLTADALNAQIFEDIKNLGFAQLEEDEFAEGLYQRLIDIQQALLAGEDRSQRAEELIRKLIDQTDFNGHMKLKFCKFCHRKLTKGHWCMCPVEKAKSFLAEVEEEHNEE